ncbi:MAG TPA: DUF3089 domain-containing protein [Povalibacter sp.]|uniref:DUF3089 domain-containing protein n=1 Tax=Povalibacter sp. TaxID=1962978 RepID=UPI002CD05785|nr:DUF3089 domain-containing protein [Povalibacter sp.]HMN45905.1 DUF3089 domain-containing protein [Povalibacter sp.]
MKKLLWGLLIVVVLAAVAAYHYRDVIVLMREFSALQPQHAFDQEAPADAPDYSLPANWAALPDRADDADVVPDASIEDRQATAAVDVFFVHPTTYYSPAHWNQPLGDVAADRFTDLFVLRNQASAFNGCCRVYAPRYRQATVYSFVDRGSDGQAALALAYDDVERAFDYFIEHYNQQRPFIVAGHSQGATHLRRLLERRITGTELVQRLVAAYPVGFTIDAEEYRKAVPDIPVCASPTQTACVATWNSVGPDVRPFEDTSGDLCVNPLSWSTDGERADFALNLGGVTFNRRFGTRVESLQEGPAFQPRIEAGVADAQCRDGLLWVSGIRSENFASRPMGRGNYHIYDFSLFYMNVRQNAAARAAQFVADRAASQ